MPKPRKFPLSPAGKSSPEESSAALVPLAAFAPLDVPDVAGIGPSLAPTAADRNPYLVYLGGLSESSVPTMRSAAAMVMRTIAPDVTPAIDPEKFPWHQLTYGIVRRLRELLRQKQSTQTVNKVLTLVRGVAREAWRCGTMPHEEFMRIADVDGVKGKQLPKGRFVDAEEIAALLAACERGGLRGLRDAVLLALLRGAGLREQEAVTIARGDIDPKTGAIIVRHAKRNKERVAVLETAYDDIVARWLAAAPSRPEAPLLLRFSSNGKALSEPLRGMSTQAVGKALLAREEEAGLLRHFTAHDLRRSYITYHLERGVDHLQLARLVGHENPKTTAIYDRRAAESDRRAIRG